MRFGSLFAGIGGMDLGLERAGMTCAWQVEIDPFCRKVLVKHWPDVPKWDDVRTFPPEGDWSVDLIAGGFPCQPVSLAGQKKGKEDERWLWPEFARVVRILRPRFVLLENVPGLLVRGFDDVLRDLAALGYDAEWSVVSACSLGAPHARERVFLIAYRNEKRWRGVGLCTERWHEISERPHHWKTPTFDRGWEDVECWFKSIVPVNNGSANAGKCGGMGDGISTRLDRIGAIGNAVVPQVAEWIGRRILEAVS